MAPDGSRLISSDDEGGVRLWSVQADGPAKLYQARSHHLTSQLGPRGCSAVVGYLGSGCSLSCRLPGGYDEDPLPGDWLVKVTRLLCGITVTCTCTSMLRILREKDPGNCSQSPACACGAMCVSHAIRSGMGCRCILCTPTPVSAASWSVKRLTASPQRQGTEQLCMTLPRARAHVCCSIRRPVATPASPSTAAARII